MLAEQEELASLRPDLDGRQIMALLGIPPGRGGPGLPATCSSCGSRRVRWRARAREELLAWWAGQSSPN